MKGDFFHYSKVLGSKADLPEPVTVHEGNGPVIFSGPHNGLAVFGDREKPLGMERAWFAAAHEASDLHMATLFESMIPRFSQASFVWSNYSRLVADVNRMPELAIAETSSEWDDFPIHGNASHIVTPEEREGRMQSVYWPYHNALSDLVKKKKEEFGAVLLIDMHSFTPSWQGRARESEVGMLTLDEGHPLAQASCEFLSEKSGMRYISRLPYFLPERVAISAAQLVEKNTGLPYFGFEIRNDTIAGESGRERFCAMLEIYLTFVENSPRRDLIFSESIPGLNAMNRSTERAQEPGGLSGTDPEPFPA